MFQWLNSKILLKDNMELGQNYVKILEETFQWYLHCLLMRQNSFLNEPLSKFVLEYYQHGLLAHAESKWSPKAIGRIEKNDEPKVLTLEMLSAGFILWLLIVMLSLVVFICEIIFKRLSAIGD